MLIFSLLCCQYYAGFSNHLQVRVYYGLHPQSRIDKHEGGRNTTIVQEEI